MLQKSEPQTWLLRVSKMIDIAQLNLLDFVPGSIASDPDMAAIIRAVEHELHLIAEAAELPAIYARFDSLSSLEYDHLAYELGLTVWRSTWPRTIKRQVIQQSHLEMRTRGTLGAVERAIESLGSSAVIREWFEMDPQGEPGTFDITVGVAEIPGQLTAQTQDDLFRKIDEVKPRSRHYTFTLAQQFAAQMGIAATMRNVIYARLTGTAENS